MRYIQFQLIPRQEAVHSIDRVLRDDPRVSRRAIHHLRLLTDGTMVGLYELVGSISHLQSTIESHPAMHEYQISRSGDAIYVHAHTEANEMLQRLLEIQHEYDIVIETPIEYTESGEFRVIVIGPHDTLRETRKLIPDTVDLVFENTGPYVPKRRRPFARLTQRQRETVRVAVDHGYYEQPRQCTHGDIAKVMGLAAETVGEHLRKAEATLVHSVLP